MKLRTSYFNTGILHKNITRFAPLWAIYLVMGLLITLFVNPYTVGDHRYFARFANYVCDAMSAMAIINFGYGALCAYVLFADLHSTRMCYSLHAMPLRREGWFLTNAASGLLFSLVPNAIVCLVMLFKCGAYFYVPLAWLLVSTLQFLCFFGIGVLCMLITGNLIGAAGMYMLINFLSYAVYFLVNVFFGQFLTGVIISQEPFNRFVPAVQLFQVGLATDYDNMTGALLNVQWKNLGQGLLWAGVGLGMLALALLVYRRRHLEAAGDFITLRQAAPVVLVIYALGLGGVFWLVFNSNYGVLLLGLAIGFFTGRMMLQRSLKVFTRKNFLGYGLLCGAVLLSILLATLDPLGITRWVPKQGHIRQVSMSSYLYGEQAIFTDPEDVELVRTVHSYAVDNPIQTDPDAPVFGSYVSFYVRYEMKDGSVHEREYQILVDSQGGELLRKLHSQPEFLFEGFANDLSQLMAAAEQLTVYTEKYTGSPEDPKPLSPEAQQTLLEALEQDWLSGTLAQDGDFHANADYLGSLEFLLEWDREQDRHRYMNLNIFSDCTHTAAWLQQNGYLDPAPSP